MRTLELKEDRTIVFDGRPTKVTWTKEVEEDLMEFHEIDIISEITQALVKELDFQFSLSNEEKAHYVKEISEHLKL